LGWIKRLPAAFGTFLTDAEIAWKKGGLGIYCHLDASMNGSGANFPKVHPTQKPVGVMEWCIKKLKNSELVIDPFMGSGTTGVACANLGRKFIGIEIEPKYFDIACERIAAAYAQQRLFP
jgi:site-specific DNA-methyltransferase (adenine-specific)/modification methylase